MANTYKIREVTVTIPKIGIVSRDVEGNEFKCGEIYHINLFAVRPGWRTSTSDFDGLIVGRLDFSGYTESQFSRTQKIIMPNGYELVALRMSESGKPITWESLPVISLAADLSDSEPFTVKNGEVFISNAFIGNGIASSDFRVMMNTHDTGKQHAAGMKISVDDNKLEATVSEVVNNAVTEITLSESMRKAVIKAVSESDLFKSIQSSIVSESAMIEALQHEMSAAVGDAIRKELSPGGAIWNQRRAC